MSKTIFLYVTTPHLECARQIAASLVERRLAACANILGEASSIYRWDGKVVTDTETVMIVKTNAQRAAQTQAAILDMHPHDTPCISALEINSEFSNPNFLQWVGAELSRESN